MPYLSRLILNLRSTYARQDIADVHQLHRTIMRAFPAAPDPDMARQHFGVLFRAEALAEQPLAMRVLVQSRHLPNWSHLPLDYLAPAPDERGNPAVRSLDAEYEQIAVGMTLRFLLRANPTRRISQSNRAQGEQWRGKRVELRDDRDRLEWLERKAKAGGFALLSVATRPDLPDTRVSPQPNAIGYRRRDAERAKLTFGAVVFEGLLEVRDLARFRETLLDGIGSGKAYGFGLLSIATVARGV